jgi:hypothetical protein
MIFKLMQVQQVGKNLIASLNAVNFIASMSSRDITRKWLFSVNKII